MTWSGRPRVVLASLSGQSDAAWARAGSPHASAAFLGGVTLDGPTREAASAMVARGREEFLPPDPVAFIEEQLASLADVSIRPGINVRTTTRDPLARAARVCANRDAIIEINAHCRQTEMCAVGAGESLLADTERLCEQVRVARECGPDVSVKVRAETGVDLPALAEELERAGASLIHIDAMDSPDVVERVVEATGASVIANNGVRDRESTWKYLEQGADAVSVGRASDDPVVLRRVAEATVAWDDRTGATDQMHA